MGWQKESSRCSCKGCEGAQYIFPTNMSKSKDQVAEMQSIMNKQGMDIHPYKAKNEPYMNHKDYDGLKVAVYLALA